jgi:hypothetical protein
MRTVQTMLEEEVAEALARLEAFDPDSPAVTVDRERTDMRRIGAALYLVDYAHTTLVQAVADARRHGRSWTEIANVLGVSRQAARQRFNDEVEAVPDPAVFEPAVQKLLDAGLSVVESRLAVLLGRALADADSEARPHAPVAGSQLPEEKQRALWEFLTTLSFTPEGAPAGTAEQHSVG